MTLPAVPMNTYDCIQLNFNILTFFVNWILRVYWHSNKEK